jgi:hypothetical protein
VTQHNQISPSPSHPAANGQWRAWLICLGAVALATITDAAQPPPGRYETGAADLIKITADLHQALPPQLRGQFHSAPLWLEGVKTPQLRPVLHPAGAKHLCAVQVSGGLVELLNFLSHAKAIDGVDRGYYKRSITSLAVQSGETGLSALQPTHPQSWAFDTMNHQMSHFNQMAGTLLAIQMAHHRLGHYQKYADRLTDAQGQPVPLASVVTPQEWHEAVMRGVNHALKCGFGVDGLRYLYEGLEKMPSRPAWTFQLLPPNAKVSRLCRELARAEQDFFLVSDVGREF